MQLSIPPWGWQVSVEMVVVVPIASGARLLRHAAPRLDSGSASGSLLVKSRPPCVPEPRRTVVRLPGVANPRVCFGCG